MSSFLKGIFLSRIIIRGGIKKDFNSLIFLPGKTFISKKPVTTKSTCSESTNHIKETQKKLIERLEQGVNYVQKLTIKTPERHHWRCSGVFIVNFEYISYLVLAFLLLTLNM